MTPPDNCPHCGAEVPPRARACPECGADEQTGWSERAQLDRLGVSSDDFDYDEFVREEFGEGEHRQIKPRGISWFWWVVAVFVLLAFLMLYVR